MEMEIVFTDFFFFSERNWLGQNHPMGLVPKAELEFIVSQILVWWFNHYTKLALKAN